MTEHDQTLRSAQLQSREVGKLLCDQLTSMVVKSSPDQKAITISRIEMPSTTITNWRETVAFFLAHEIALLLLMAGNLLIISPILGDLLRTGRIAAFSFLSFFWGNLSLLLVLPIFLSCRALFAGVPNIVAPATQRRALVTSGPEVGAYALAYVVKSVLFIASYGLGLSKAYAAFQTVRPAVVVSLTHLIGLVFTAIWFLVMLSLRRLITRKVRRVQ